MSNDNIEMPTDGREDLTTGLPYRSNLLAIVEGVVLLGGLAWLDHSGFLSFDSLSVHPYLFVVILLSAQYGMFGGILAAMGAIILSHAGGLPGRAFDMSYAEHFRLVWADSLSWVLSALMVGVVTTQRVRVLRDHTFRLRKATLAQDLIAAQYQVLAQRTHELERSLAGRFQVRAVDDGTPPAEPTRPRSTISQAG